MSVRVRFAPSPTGHLHVGGARTALFNWLFARQQGGTYLLRIEDTDLERSQESHSEAILESLRWLGLSWDEGPIYQSGRLAHYRLTVDRLLEEERAYACVCSEEEVEKRRRASLQDMGALRRHHACRERPGRRGLPSERSYTVRFLVPEGERIHFEDLVYGPVEVVSDQLDDFVILRSDKTPTYHLSVVSDDVAMGISHVIRGVDHLSNTPKHLLLYAALGETPPVYAHLPLILGPDKKRLSKRHGATSVLEYQHKGFLPGALLNYLALLGWSPGDDRELFSVEELVQAFDLTKVNKSNAVFDFQKLEWINSQHISRMPARELAQHLFSFFRLHCFDSSLERGDHQEVVKAVELLQSRAKTLEYFLKEGRAFFTDDFDYSPEAVRKQLHFAKEEAPRLVQALHEAREALQRLPSFDQAQVETLLRGIVKEHHLKAGKLFGAIRVGLTGQSATPGLFEVIATLGRERTLHRLSRLIRYLQS